MRRWQFAYDNRIDEAAVGALCSELDILPATAKLLWQRGYTTPELAGRFIRSEDSFFHDPFLMADMDKAVERILLALDKGEKVMIFGDYDVDGVTSVSTLYLFLSSIGISCDYHIPSRIGEGYGISTPAIDQIIDDGYTLMISVDTGITACAEIEYAEEHGLETVVTDHHECHSDIPRAVAVVNPKRPDCAYPFKELAGVGVVFKLITALRMRLNRRAGRDENPFRSICNEYADLIATGTIADVMPLVDENRLIVSMGLRLMEKSPRLGISALLDKAGAGKNKRITSSTIGYTLAPRINAAGRLSEASIACELMLSKERKEADSLAETLCDFNEQRRCEENAIAKEAAEMIATDYDFESNPVIVLAKENWHHGVIGIVSSRLTDKYGLPTILVSFDEDGMGKGSGRSVKGLNLVEALSAVSDTLEKFGGHELAAGLSVRRENFDAFCKRINEYACEHFDHDAHSPTCTADLELDSEDIDLRQANELFLLEPFGTDNPAPVFVICDATVAEIRGIGANKHSRIGITKGNRAFGCVYFGMSPEEASFKKGDKVDVVFSLEINEYKGITTPQINIRHILPDRKTVEKYEGQKQLYRQIKNGARYKITDEILPSRKEFAALYTYIKRCEKKGMFTLNELISQAGLTGENRICKLRFMLDVFTEMKLLTVDKSEDDFEVKYKITLRFVRGKVNLDKSIVLQNLRSKQDK
ncbi:MAG: single-stranded-DNA-specific exonuclease RecJ [Clostridia bacterium]|nr:single-stranded-DNA-specific exonuclease RecJ [Clostridia bacterium]